MDTVIQGTNALGDFFLLSLDKELYSREAIMKTCYGFTDQYYLHVVKVADETTGICFYNKEENQPAETINIAILQFLHLLQENQMRQIILAQTSVLHEEIVRKAFSPAASLIAEPSQNDPLHILTSAE